MLTNVNYVDENLQNICIYVSSHFSTYYSKELKVLWDVAKVKCNFSMKHVNIIYLNVIRNTKNVIFIFGSHITIFAFVIMIIWCNLNNGWNVGRRCILSQIEIFFATNIMSLRYYHFMSKTLPNNISELNVLWFHLTIIYKEFWQE